MQLSEKGSRKSQYYEDDDFQSFSSHNDHSASQISGDEHNFKVHEHYKEKQIQIPQIPKSLPKLYEIYLQNIKRKNQLNEALKELKEKQITLIRMKYDDQNSSMEEFIDIDEDSPQYELSLKRFKERQGQLKKLQKQYQSLKTMSIQATLKKDPIIKKTLEKYIQENKQIHGCYVCENRVYVLCKEKKRLKKILFNSLTSKEALRKSKSSEEQSEDKDVNNFKYVIRMFSFVKAASFISFSPIQKFSTMGLPLISRCKGLVHDKKNRFFIHDDKRIFQIPSGKCTKVDKSIVFFKIRKNQLFVGTQDSVLRVYEIQDQEIKIRKLISCYYSQNSTFNCFTLTRIPQIILFVENDTRLCQMNIQTFTPYLLSQLPQPILKLNEKFLITKNMLYKDYFQNQGKVSLVHAKTLKTKLKDKEFIDSTTHNSQEFIIYDEEEGNYGIFPV